MPADKGQIKNKSIPLLTVHHIAASLKSLLLRHIRILRQQIRDHPVLIRLVDARDHKKQRPQKDKQVVFKHDIYNIFVITVKSAPDF